jgi:hypothetical protein
MRIVAAGAIDAAVTFVRFAHKRRYIVDAVNGRNLHFPADQSHVLAARPATTGERDEPLKKKHFPISGDKHD